MSGRSRSIEFRGAPEALAALRATLAELPAEQVQPLRAAVPEVVSRVLRVARSYGEDRRLFAATFTKAGFDPARYDDLEARALALWQADVDYRLVLDPGKNLPALIDEGTPLRKRMMRAAEYLWSDDEALGTQIERIRQGRGHMDLADDLVSLAALFEAHWSYAESRCTVTSQDLVAARRAGLALMHALSGGDRDDAVLTARDMRDRAGAYTLRGARDVRAAAAYVFRDAPERLELYPNPLARPVARRRPAPPPENSELADEQPEAPAADEPGVVRSDT